MNKKLPYYLLRSMQVFLIFSCIAFTKVNAQGFDTTDITPYGYLDTLTDNFGNKYPITDMIVNDTLRARYGSNPVVQPLLVQNCGSDYFELYFENGWEGNTVDEAARRDVICRVAYDLSKFINSPLTGTSEKVRIWIRNPSNMSFAVPFAVASPFHCAPSNANISGIIDNVMWITINSGKDAYTNVAPPVYTTIGSSSGNTFFHGLLSINFGTVFIHDLLTPSFSSSSEHDLYTVVLHEMMHALGFYSLIIDDGSSAMGATFPYYSRYDTKLQTQTPDQLITNSGTCSMYNWEFNSFLSTSVLQPSIGNCSTPDIPVCSTALQYAGSVTSPIYTPNCWAAGSSLSHFEDACPNIAQNNLYYVMSNRSPGGTNSMKRHPTAEERKVLCDIGYKIDDEYGNNTTAANSHYNYSGGTCPGFEVAGINDGIAGGQYTYVYFTGNPNVVINSSTMTDGFMTNDYGVTGFECLEDITPGTPGTCNIYNAVTTTATVQYTPPTGATGVRLLRYVPVKGNVRGNITYIYVYIYSNCTGTPCNMVKNFDLEISSGCGIIPMFSTLNCWEALINTPDLFSSTCGNTTYMIPTGSAYCNPPAQAPTANNFKYTGMAANPVATEAIQTILTTPILNNGTQYTISFWCRTANVFPYDPADAYIWIGGSLAPIPHTMALGNPPGVTALTGNLLVPNDGEWHYITQQFSYTGPTVLNNLCVIPTYGVTTGSYLLVDEVRLLPSADIATFAPPTNLDICETINDLSDHVSVPGGAFSGTGVVLNGGTYSFVASIAGAGLQTIQYDYTDNNGCAKTVYAQVLVDAVCSPCPSLGSIVYTALAPSVSGPGTITTNTYANTNFYINNDVEINGAVTFTNCRILIAPGVTIKVLPTSTLTLNGSHLYSCTDMWDGIVLDNNGTNTGKLICTSGGPTVRGTLIEDATVAVSIPSVITPLSSSPILVTDNTCFNRNTHAIDIGACSQTNVGSLFSIQNTIFTSRDFGGYTSGPNAYPVVWPINMSELKATTTNTYTLHYDPPYKLSNDYNPASCKNTSPAETGIRLTNVGPTTGTTSSPVYNEIQIGNSLSGTGYQANLFENLFYGIHALSSNFACVDNHFANIISSNTTDGSGIFARSFDNSGYTNNRIRIYEPDPTIPLGNYFYNCTNGAEIMNYREILAQESYIASKQSTLVPSSNLYGYKIEGAKYDNINIDHNEIYNIKTGIGYTGSYYYSLGFGSQAHGIINIQYNYISPDFPTTSGGNRFVEWGISLYNPVQFPGTTGLATVNNNNVLQVNNGIYAGKLKHKSMIRDNAITLRDNSVNGLQYGIQHVNTRNSTVQVNDVTGFGITTGQAKGIFCETSTAYYLKCNSVRDANRAIEFSKINQFAQFRGNLMTNNKVSFVLNNATIGTQFTGNLACENEWLTSGGFNYTGTNYQTYVLNQTSNPNFAQTNSTLNVQNTVPTKPTNNAANPTNYQYAVSNGLNVSNKVMPQACPVKAKHDHDYPVAVITNQLKTGTYGAVGAWIEQKELWEALKSDTSLLDTTALTEFMEMGDSSRFAMLYAIDSLLEDGDTGTARTLVNAPGLLTPRYDSSGNGIVIADDSLINPVIDNYIKYYNIVLNYTGGTQSLQDSITIDSLAGLCPMTDGVVVYNARMLYNSLHNEIGHFETSCGDEDDSLWLRPIPIPQPEQPFTAMAGKGMQAYNLLPNPNNGNFIVQQLVNDEKAVDAEVWNAVGAKVHKASLYFKGNKAQVNTCNLTPGTYLLKLRDSKGVPYIIKFTVL